MKNTELTVEEIKLLVKIDQGLRNGQANAQEAFAKLLKIKLYG